MTEYDERGNPLPEPTDTCDFCGRPRPEVEELVVEVMAPFGEVEYLCRRCVNHGRGMK